MWDKSIFWMKILFNDKLLGLVIKIEKLTLKSVTLDKI